MTYSVPVLRPGHNNHSVSVRVLGYGLTFALKYSGQKYMVCDMLATMIRSCWPDWLLLEIDSDILIRWEQVDVAHAIIAPESRKNTVLQLNMGKGKSSIS